MFQGKTIASSRFPLCIYSITLRVKKLTLNILKSTNLGFYLKKWTVEYQVNFGHNHNKADDSTLYWGCILRYFSFGRRRTVRLVSCPT